MSRATLVHLIETALRGNVRAALASKREQEKHSAEEWSAMTREAYVRIKGVCSCPSPEALPTRVVSSLPPVCRTCSCAILEQS